MTPVDESGSGRSHLAPMQQIEVILHEYDALRDEIVENLSRQQTLLVVWTTFLLAFIGLITQVGSSPLLLLLPLAGLLFLTIEAGRQFSMLLKAAYISVLEQQINAIAGRPLLTWEHAASTAHFGVKIRFKHPTEGYSVLNSSLVLSALYPVLMIILVLFGVCRGGEYLHSNLALTYTGRIAAVAGYGFLHLFILGSILVSRLRQDSRVLAVYSEIVRGMRDLWAKGLIICLHHMGWTSRIEVLSELVDWRDKRSGVSLG